MTPEERAARVETMRIRANADPFLEKTRFLLDELDRVTAERDDWRTRSLEEAAKVAETVAGSGRCNVCGIIANEIRALKEKP